MANMEAEPSKCELVFGLVGPIGVDVDRVILTLQELLSKVSYSNSVIHLMAHANNNSIGVKIDNSSYFNMCLSKIEYGNEYRKLAKTKDAFAGIAVSQIRFERERLTGDQGQSKPAHAYIFRQFKRAEEIDAMRAIYGRKFIQISIFASEEDRRCVLKEKISRLRRESKRC